MASLVLALAIGRPNGWRLDCNQNGYTVPTSMIRIDEPTFATITCQELTCTLHNATFKGFIISATAQLTPVTPNAQEGLNSHCLTHTSSSDKSNVTFTVSESTTVWAVIVSGKNGLQHRLGSVEPKVVDFTNIIHIIGAGPGKP